MTFCQYCLPSSASNSLKGFKHTIPTVLPRLVRNEFPGIDISTLFSTSTITNLDLMSVPATDWSQPSSLMSLTPARGLEYGMSTTILNLDPTYTSIILDEKGPSPLQISQSLASNPDEQLLEMNAATLQAKPVRVVNEQTTDSKSADQRIARLASTGLSFDTARLATKAGSLAVRTPSWSLPFGTTTAMSLPASTGFVGTIHGVCSGIVTGISSATSSHATTSTAAQNQTISSIIVDNSRGYTTTVTATTTLLVETLEAAEPTSPTVTHSVQVGAFGKLIFDPITVNAAVGDLVEFEFLASNHTLTQSTLEKPCQSSNAFDSGFQYFNPTNQTGVVNQRLIYLVTDSEPHWFFCQQQIPVSHCHAGMVFSINAGQIAPEFAAHATQRSATDNNRTYHTISAQSTGSSAVGHSAFSFGASIQASSPSAGSANITITGGTIGNYHAINSRKLLLFVMLAGLCWSHFCLCF